MACAAPDTRDIPGTPELLKVILVERLPEDGTRVLNHFLEGPKEGAGENSHVLEFSGWVLGVAQDVAHVALHLEGFEEEDLDIGQLAVERPRPDVRAAFPAARPQACGYQGSIALWGREQTLVYRLLAVFDDGARVPLYRITIRHGALGSAQTLLKPLLVTTLGRSGSMLLTMLLGSHPEIRAYKPGKYEARVCTYWTDMFLTLCQPRRYLQALTANDASPRDWWLDDKLPAGTSVCAATAGYLARDGIDALVDFARARVDGFYRACGGTEGGRAPRYFVEKCVCRLTRLAILSVFPGAREILLVRDLRDMLCSILAYNRKIGRVKFRRELVATDVEYVRTLRVEADRMLHALRFSQPRPILLRYEDLILQPDRTLRGLLTELNLDASDAVIEGLLAGRSQDVFAVHGTSRDPASSIGRWRGELDAEMRAACREHFAGALAELGYAPTEPD